MKGGIKKDFRGVERKAELKQICTPNN